MNTKPITGFERYTIHDNCTIYDNKSLRWLQLTPNNINGARTYLRVNLVDVVTEKPKAFLVHRLLAQAFIDNPDNLPHIDHIDGNGLNNTISNLRWVDHAMNMQNRRVNINSTSKYMGVSWDNSRSKWAVNIHINNKKKFLGRFVDEVIAAEVYDIAAKELGYLHVNF